MAFRIVNGRGRVVRRVAVATVAAGVVALGAVVVPAVASASSDIGQSDPLAVSAADAPRDHEDDAKKNDDRDVKKDDVKKDENGGDDGENGGDDSPGQDGAIRPGAEIQTELGLCTVNFLYRAGERVFVGYAAHCSSPSTETAITDTYCLEDSDPLGTEVLVAGAQNPATLAYSSWLALQATDEEPGDRCMYNDFALAELSSEDVDNIDPSVPQLGGPEALATNGVMADDEVFGYLPNRSTPAVKQGVVQAVLADGMSYMIQTEPDSHPGDSGGPYLDAQGNAFGVLSGGAEDSVLADDGFSLVTDLSMALSYAIANDEVIGADLAGLELATGDEPFSTDGIEMTPMPGGPSTLEVLDLLDALGLL